MTKPKNLGFFMSGLKVNFIIKPVLNRYFFQYEAVEYQN